MPILSLAAGQFPILSYSRIARGDFAESALLLHPFCSSIFSECFMRIYTSLFLLLAGLVCLTGCGGPEIAPVKGRVLFKGKAVANAAVTFNPLPSDEKDLKPGKPGTGFTDAGGN